ncbi:MAG TPA: hypothetical protein VHX86_04990 [Tepidisphaeraceae bacterium]|jgi:hypothetical protein|nr:hypothetical protein [Tepidisphaeraceae bacterium]
MTDAVSHSQPIDDRPFGHWVLGLGKSSGTIAQVALFVAAAVGCVIFTFGSRWFGIPVVPGFDGSILEQPNPVVAFFAIAVLLVIALLVGTALAGAVRFEAGLFAATCGLAAISVRCGTMQSVLLETGGNDSVYVGMTVHLLIFAAFIVGLWALLWVLGRANSAAPGEADLTESAFVNRCTAGITQIIATAVFIMFLCQTEAKNQALASVAIASFLGAVIAYKYSPVRPSIWYWSGPLIVGLIGYILAAMGQDANLAIGSPTGTFAALARPLPIDYASVGTAGAILGYWVLRKKEVVSG